MAEISPSLDRRSTRWAYQLDLFDPAKSDLRGARGGGPLSSVFRAAAREIMRRRGLRHHEVAAAVGLSRGQLGNVLAGRFGLSSAAMERFMAWLTTDEDANSTRPETP